jgi:hypothetical protein
MTKMKNMQKRIKRKKQYTDFYFFLQNCKKMEIEIFAFSIITCLAPQNDRLNLSFVKDFHVIGKKNVQNWSLNGHLAFANFGKHPLV